MCEMLRLNVVEEFRICAWVKRLSVVLRLFWMLQLVRLAKLVDSGSIVMKVCALRMTLEP